MGIFGIKGMIGLALVTVIAVSFAIIARNWHCEKPPKPPKPKDYEVSSVPNGAMILVKVGLRDRRTATVRLASIAAPMQEWKDCKCSECKGTGKEKPPKEWVDSHPEDNLDFVCSMCSGTGQLRQMTAEDAINAERSRQNLERLAGKTIMVEQPRHRLFRSADGQESDVDEGVEDDADDGPVVMAAGVIVAVAYGESGQCLNQEQVAAGWATCLAGAPKEWLAAEAKAKKAKLGIWAK